MILLANCEAEPGFFHTVAALKAGTGAVDALVEGIGHVEADPAVRSVGYGGWPNMIGEMECDAGVMDGTTREVGAVGAVPRTLPVARLAREVMRRLPHVMLTGAGARRFADESGFSSDEMLHPDSARGWWDKLEGLLDPAQRAAFPELPLAPFFVARLLGRTNTIADMPAFDRSLFESLMFLKRFEGSAADFEALTLTFAVEQFTDEALPAAKRRQV
ncbi:isoaspartyl peptidase/L-asparaginase, partial [Palleronia sp.]|uniref:isoaspartyl peptidase/L-asparaginase n=1 Tax=Palleronia sp. TaxID=1940284 RepID=UPI0035C849B5